MRDTTDGHVRYRQLVDLADGTLEGSRRKRADAHLDEGCDRCAATLGSVNRLTKAIGGGPLAQAPRSLSRRAVRLFGASRRAAALKNAGSILARVLFDERVELAPALRATAGTSRRLLWALDGYEMFATVVSRTRGCDFEGQLLPMDDDGENVVTGEVAVLRGGREVARARLDAEGRFTFRGLARAAHTLEGTVGGTRFHVPPIVLD